PRTRHGHGWTRVALSCPRQSDKASARDDLQRRTRHLHSRRIRHPPGRRHAHYRRRSRTVHSPKPVDRKPIREGVEPVIRPILILDCRWTLMQVRTDISGGSRRTYIYIGGNKPLSRKFAPPPVTPPPTLAFRAVTTPALQPPSRPNRPDSCGNRSGRRPATGPASCPLFAGFASEHARVDRLRVRHRCDQAACLIRCLLPPKRAPSDRHRGATRAVLAATNRSCSSPATEASCRLRVLSARFRLARPARPIPGCWHPKPAG